MQGGARKAAMAGCFFFTKKTVGGDASPRRAHCVRQAGFMSGSDRCAAIPVLRAGQAVKSSDAGTEAGAAPPPPTARGRPVLCPAATVAPPPAPLARGRPQKRAAQARKPGPHPRRVRPAARTAFFCKGGARNCKKGRERSGGAGGDGRSGRAHGMGKRPSAGDGRTDDGGAGRGKRKKRKGEWARAEGEGRRGEWARAEGRACRG